MRHTLVSDLYKELIGPRDGSTEVLGASDDPRNEYASGQLYPPNLVVNRDPEDEEALGQGAESGEEDSDDQPNLMNKAFLEAGQNFRRVPSSLGISFVLDKKPTKGQLGACVTWGRYAKNSEGKWIRTPHYFITDFDGVNASPPLSEDKTLQVTFKCSNVKGDLFKISVFAQTCIVATSEGRPQTEEIIFQPEIRISLAPNLNLRELGDVSFASNDAEWRVSTRQYDRLNIYSRGHLCGAYWKEIDPQRPFEKEVDDLAAPFVWTDGQYFLPTVPRIKEFLLPNLRTDFMPLYPSPAAPKRLADETWDDDNLRADRLADCTEKEELLRRLNMLVTSYDEWIRTQVKGAGSDETNKTIVERHEVSLRRIKAGVEFIKSDDEAQLAFRFMNKVMAKQYSWGKTGEAAVMVWRPFQLAFILLALESTAKETADREICDTIWFPTGGGKTEAYLGLAAFSLAYRRRSSPKEIDGSASGEGTGVVSRYTLRLLTIQQFRRALKMIAACEILRLSSRSKESQGWLPDGWPKARGMVWGRSSFSLGLWVGSAVTPNAMIGTGFREHAPGALNLLSGPARKDEPDPAQIIECPCCASVFSIPVEGIPNGKFILRLNVYGQPDLSATTLAAAASQRFTIERARFVAHKFGRAGFLTLELAVNGDASAQDLHLWWTGTAAALLRVDLLSFNVTRPGYVRVEGKKGQAVDYEIRCPNPECELNNVEYVVKEPSDERAWVPKSAHALYSTPKDPTVSWGAPIGALTVDSQLYAAPPSMLISTVDKFVRTTFISEAASLFGRVRSYTSDKGFSQVSPEGAAVAAQNFLPPSLIIQDELHLLDGPLGSTFGLFETAVEHLCEKPKYIASSATIRNSLEQVLCLMGRKTSVFPSVNLDIAEGFFLRSREIHPLDESSPGRMFLGVAFPGRAPQTPMLRIWGRLLQSAQDLLEKAQKITDPGQREKYLDRLDHYWTLIGYFNAVRELAQGEALMRQDIPQYIDKLHKQHPGNPKRAISSHTGFRNLSSQTGSSDLPGILAKMERRMVDGDALNAVASTSMFGTGVDVSRLSLMVVHGQPKSASQYIQAVGRVGRRQPGLAVVFFRVSKPRDLNHYEYFTGYHRKLPIAVEPIAVKPLSPKAIDKTLGSLITILIRNWRDSRLALPEGIEFDEGGSLISQISPAMLKELLDIFDRKWRVQPDKRRNLHRNLMDDARAEIQRWQEYARKQTAERKPLNYDSGDVRVLGQNENDPSVFPNAPQSLRDVEPTIRIQTGGE